MLSIRFFGGGLVALIVAWIADNLLRTLEFPTSYAAILGIAAILMLISAVIFTAMGEPKRETPLKAVGGFFGYLRDGVVTFQTDPVFRRFVFAQWCGGAVLIAAPFFIVAANRLEVGFENVALLMGTQTLGALLGNPLWGWWGDYRGKLSLMRGIAIARAVPPVTLLYILLFPVPIVYVVPILLIVFFSLGALMNGLTIAVIGLLMEISPDDRRPAYSGYFNALTAPAFILPLVGGFAVAASGLWIVFAVALVAAVGQVAFLAGIELQK
jgi:hypothetical protein